MNNLVNKITNAISYHFENSIFRLQQSSYNTFIVSGNNLSEAINIHKNGKNSVNTLNWFNDFWIYFEIKFSKIEIEIFTNKFERESYEAKLQQSNIKIEKDYFNINVTLSVFQGEADDKAKTQLFRAEWDNYDDNIYHPQPHWQINPFKYGSKTYEDFETFMQLTEEESFEDKISVAVKSNELIKINKFHFAMSGYWAENRGYIHKINNEIILLNWLNGIFGHIKEQLKFVKG